MQSNLILEGIYTHFATTDEFVEEQMNVFNKYLNICKKFKLNPIVHADNSFVNEKFNHDFDMIRIGFSLFDRNEGGFLPVVNIKSEIVETQKIKKGEMVGYSRRFVATKEMKVAIIPLGYADGFSLKYIGMELNVNNTKCKILNICMDSFMLDISKTKLKKGDEVFILNNSNSLQYFAKYLTISEYEVMTNFSHMRARRIVV